MTALALARTALEAYVAGLLLHPEAWNPAKLRFLEGEIERAVHNMELTAPF